MDSKAVFFRTSKGEDEISGKTADLYSAIKRVLLMVDGSAAFGEINKRSAPSMRASLDEMLQELEKGGYIHEKAKTGTFPKMSMPPKISVPPKMAIPPKLVVPHKEPPSTNKPAEKSGGDLDFMDEFFAATPAQLVAGAGKEGKQKAEEEKKSRQESDAAKIKAQQEAEAILLKAEQDAARIREVAERARQEAAQVQAKLEAAKLKVEQEAKARLAEAARAQQQAEAARTKAAQEAALAHEASERIARQEREIAKAREEAEKLARQQAADQASMQAKESAREIKPNAFAFDLSKDFTPPPIVEPPKTVQPVQKETSSAPNPAPESKPEPEIKLDPFFVFDPFQLPASSPGTPQKKTVSAIEVEPEIKLDTLIKDALKVATPPPAEPHKAVAQQPGNTAKTSQPEEVRQPAKQQAPTLAATKAVESNSNQEQIKLTEAQAKKLATAQARDAVEQREADAAKAKRELSFQKSLPPIAKPAPQKVPARRANSKPFLWGKLTMFMLALLAGALFVVPYVLPMRDYMPKVQQMLSAKLQQPVHLGQLGGRILPTPRLELGEIYIGDVKQLQVQQAQINFSIMGLFGETKPINSIELEGVKVTGAGLQSASVWLQQLAIDNQYPVRRMMISQGSLDADDIQFTGIDGELDFNQAGKFMQANLRANGGKTVLGIKAVPESRFQVAITMHTSALPLLPSWSFDELTANGELSSNGLRISNFEGRTLGGLLQGDANIDWRSGWLAQGTLAAKSITMQNMAKGLSGDMEGSGRFQMQATSLSKLADTAMLDGTFTIKKGVINGIDIVETARSRSKESIPGGRTHFEELSGALTVARNNYTIRQLRMNAGELVVSGTMDITKQQLSGRISADLTKWAGMGKVTMQLGGTTDNPALLGAP